MKIRGNNFDIRYLKCVRFVARNELTTFQRLVYINVQLTTSNFNCFKFDNFFSHQDLHRNKTLLYRFI